MNQLLLLSLTVLTDNKHKRETSLFSILVVVLSMSPFLLSKKVFSRLRPPMVTLTWVEKISIISLSTIAWLTSRRRPVLISKETQELSEDSELNVRKLRESSQLLIRPQLNVKHLLRVKITIPTSQELSLKNFAWISSDNVCHQSRVSLRMLKLARVKFMKSYSSVDLLESLRSNKCFQISSMVRILTRVSTQMRLLLTVLQYRLLFLLDKEMRKHLSFFFWMLHHLLWVLKPLVV